MHQQAALAIEQERSDRTLITDGVADEFDLLSDVKAGDAPPGIVADIKRVSESREPQGLLEVGAMNGQRISL